MRKQKRLGSGARVNGTGGRNKGKRKYVPPPLWQQLLESPRATGRVMDWLRTRIRDEETRRRVTMELAARCISGTSRQAVAAKLVADHPEMTEDMAHCLLRFVGFGRDAVVFA